jgi:hypothetical protein
VEYERRVELVPIRPAFDGDSLFRDPAHADDIR